MHNSLSNNCSLHSDQQESAIWVPSNPQPFLGPQTSPQLFPWYSLLSYHIGFLSASETQLLPPATNPFFVFSTF